MVTAERREVIHRNQRAWYFKNKPRILAKRRAYRAANLLEIRRLRREDRKANPEKFRDQERKHNYGIAAEAYRAMKVNQMDACAACGIPEANLKKKLGVDHHHSSGKVRWLLCSQCNVAIGMARDSPVLLRRLADMLDTLDKRSAWN